MHPPARFDEVQSHGGNKRKVSILLVGRIRSDEAGEQDRRVQNHQEAEPGSNMAGGCVHAPSARTRGSVRYSNASATRLPASRSTVEQITAPMTRWRSRAPMASRRSGPRPGQLIIASTTSEVLSKPAIERPRSEMRGFAAARSALRKRSLRDGMPRA